MRRSLKKKGRCLTPLYKVSSGVDTLFSKEICLIRKAGLYGRLILHKELITV